MLKNYCQWHLDYTEITVYIHTACLGVVIDKLTGASLFQSP